MEQENEPTLAVILEEINGKLNVLIKQQEEIKNELQQKNKAIMQRINKIQEYNEIDEMRIKILNEHVDKVARKVLEIEDKLY